MFYKRRLQKPTSKGVNMRTLGGALIAVLGALIGVAGFSLFQSANNTIMQGNRLWGMGWFFSNMSQSNADMYRNGGIAGMVIGGIILVIGLVVAFRGNRNTTGGGSQQ
jgi:hypothetical protein